MQQQINDFRRRHPQQDTTLSDTIQPLAPTRIRLPFRYLRTWIFSLLALVALPVGLALFLIGAELEENLDRNWEETRAEVRRYEAGDGVSYEIDESLPGDAEDGYFAFDADSFMAFEPGRIIVSASVCDLVSRFVVPQERGEEFPIWYDEDNPSQHSCVPITRDVSGILMIVGAALVVFSAWRLIRTFHSAGTKPA